MCRQSNAQVQLQAVGSICGNQFVNAGPIQRLNRNAWSAWQLQRTLDGRRYDASPAKPEGGRELNNDGTAAGLWRKAQVWRGSPNRHDEIWRGTVHDGDR
jgi:hypothetical protein